MKIDIFSTNKKYKIIYADPPWQYADKGCSGACEKHYSTMTLKELCELPINRIADNDCILFIWSTYPMLQETMAVIKNWGFKYKSIAFQWVKLNKSGKGYFLGLGRWTRGNTEPCLIAVKGKPYKFLKNRSVSQLIVEPIGVHSAKPNIVRNKIVELCGDIPRIELFARQEVDNWDCWGDEV